METQHRVPFCGKRFTMKNKTYIYLEADFDFIAGEYVSVIKFQEAGKKPIYVMAETEFFSKVSKNDLY